MAVKTNTKINGYDYYRIRKTIGKDKDGAPVIQPFYGVSKKDAEAKRDNYLQKKALGLKITKQLSLAQAMKIWLWQIDKFSGIGDGTFERHEGQYRNHIQDSELGHMILDEIDKLVVQQHYNKMFAAGTPCNVLKTLNKFLSKFFRYCVEEGYLLRNPCIGIKFKAYLTDAEQLEDEDEGKIETYSEDEIKKFPLIRNEKLRIMVRLALGTGLREGELLALDEADIENMVVNVAKSLKLVKIFDSEDKFHYEMKVSVLKTKKKGKRKVSIPPKLKKDLAELKKIKAKEKLKLGEAYRVNTLLFPSETGTYINRRNLLRAWERAQKQIDIPYRKFHALRHTFATQLLKKGEQLLIVSRLLGHASVKTTEIYAHVLPEVKSNATAKLDNLF